MANIFVRQDLREAGGLLLRAADEAGLRPAAAAWIFDHGLEEWRFYIVSPLVGHVEKSQIYDAIADIMSGLQLPDDFSIIDIYLDGMNGRIFRLIGHAIGVKGGEMMEVRDCLFNGVKVDAIIYRFDIAQARATEAEVASFVKRRKKARKDNEQSGKKRKYARV